MWRSSCGRKPGIVNASAVRGTGARTGGDTSATLSASIEGRARFSTEARGRGPRDVDAVESRGPIQLRARSTSPRRDQRRTTTGQAACATTCGSPSQEARPRSPRARGADDDQVGPRDMSISTLAGFLSKSRFAHPRMFPAARGHRRAARALLGRSCPGGSDSLREASTRTPCPTAKSRDARSSSDQGGARRAAPS